MGMEHKTHSGKNQVAIKVKFVSIWCAKVRCFTMRSFLTYNEIILASY